ncbi:MAG: XylR family transcriptional regulator [Pirellulales bacterium]|nr:XylR family transcriptional regulator [Pirellulales bacterium]
MSNQSSRIQIRRPSAPENGERSILLALGWYYPEMHRGVVRFARSHNWHLFVDLEEMVPKHWQGHGVITLLAARQNTWKKLRHLKVPIVDLAESQPEIPLPRVTMDNAAIGQMAAEYFLNHGYRHFVFMDRWGMGVSQRRGQYFQETLQEVGRSCRMFSWQEDRGKRNDTRENRHRWIIHRLREMPKPLAVLASRDVEAIEILEACFSANLLVPEQVAVLGVDNSENFCDCLRVPLSSIDDRLEKIGYEGAALLERILQGEKPPTEPIYIPPAGIVERRSTDCLAVDHPEVAKALHFIYKHAHLPITLRDVLQHLTMSRSGLEKAFREHYVRAPMEELRRIRLERAQKMLLETDEKILTIARLTGFQTPQNLCRFFTEQLGITPKRFRLAHRKM